MADAAYEMKKVEALQNLNQTMQQILLELKTIRQTQQTIAQKR